MVRTPLFHGDNTGSNPVKNNMRKYKIISKVKTRFQTQTAKRTNIQDFKKQLHQFLNTPISLKQLMFFAFLIIILCVFNYEVFLMKVSIEELCKVVKELTSDLETLQKVIFPNGLPAEDIPYQSSSKETDNSSG